MSLVSSPYDLNQVNHQIAPLREAELFSKDDLEFRTITTLLHRLGTRERINLDNFHVPTPQRTDLKLLAALSALLVRHAESIAVMPKRSVLGTTLFVGSGVENMTGQYFPGDESTSPAKSITSRDDFVTRNPENMDPVGPVQLLDSLTGVDIGSDIFAFSLQNWEQSFEQHVQSFAYLLNRALANPDDDKAGEALDIFSFFQSTRKIYRRFTHPYNPWLEAFLELKPRFKAAHVPSLADKSRIRALLTINPTGIKSHRDLYEFLRDPPVDEQQWLPAFHEFFVWFLRMIVEDIQQLKELRSSDECPTVLPENDIERAYNNLAGVKYFSWNSKFFTGYICEAFALGIVDPVDSGVNFADGGSLNEVKEAIPVGSTREIMSDKEPQNEDAEDAEDDMELDISTEFETGVEQDSSASSDHTHPFILELRLASSNIQNISTIFKTAPRCHFRFQVIQYAPAGHSLKPWRNLIQELFPQEEVCKKIVQLLVDTAGKRFNCFRPGGPDLEFDGQAHCEAVLGCLFSLTKRIEDNSWSGIPQSVLQEIGTCYSLLAPSKRCCPVCATIISLLSEEDIEAGGSGIHSLSKHSITFPCALPVGLPNSIRHRLLNKYRNQLRVRLTELLDKSLNRSSSTKSTQSAALSHDGEDSETKLTPEQKQLLRTYKTGWAVLDHEERHERWQEARRGLAVGQLMTWLEEMSEDMKLGLLPPGQVEKPVLMPVMQNLSLVSEVQA